MMRIRKLSALLVNQIAAGEVIERPASVVKELVENSLDAGATRIDVAVEQGGGTLIRIADNGHGIAAEDLPLAVEPHATSKLASAADLEEIGTLGFRGEALASIGSVARLRVTSRATVDGRPAEAGAVLEVAGEKIGEPAPAGCAPGTVIEVRDLFFNTPARRKFMRSAQTEIGHINDIVARTAMMHPAVGFTLSHNGRRTLDLPAVEDRARRCIDVIGGDLAEAMLVFEHAAAQAGSEARPARVWGMAGLPSIGRANGRGQYMAINGRPIRDRNLQHAIREGYRGLLPMDRFPVAVVFLEMDRREVDVNVHPAKSEVRFRNPSAVHGLVVSAIRQRLHGEDLTPEIGAGAGAGVAAGRWGRGGLTPPAGPEAPGGGGGRAGADAFVDYFRRMAPAEQGLVFQQVREQMVGEAPSVGDRPEACAGTEVASGGRSVLQVADSYLVTEDAEGLLIVDQHALHERVMFEELAGRVLGDGRPLESQRLLMPEQVPADARQQGVLEDLAPLLARLGIEAEPMGPQTVGVHAFPSFLFSRGVEVGPFMEELLARAEAGEIAAGEPNAQEAALHTVIDMMSCKAAVKAGDRMSPEEWSALLARREDVERSSSCPHGRPTTLRLTFRELERRFGRS